MTDEFGGIPVEETQVTRDEFGGIAVDQPAVPGMKKLGALPAPAARPLPPGLVSDKPVSAPLYNRDGAITPKPFVPMGKVASAAMAPLQVVTGGFEQVGQGLQELDEEGDRRLRNEVKNTGSVTGIPGKASILPPFGIPSSATLGGLSKVIRGAGQAALPVAGPTMWAHKAASALALGVGIPVTAGVEAASEAAGVPKGTSEFLGTGAGIVAGGYATKLPRVAAKVSEAFRYTDPIPTLVKGVRPRAANFRFAKDMQRAMPELKLTESTTGKPIAGIDDLLGPMDETAPGAIRIAKQRLRTQYDQMVGPQREIGGTVDMTPVADAMVGSISKKVRLENPEIASRIEETAEKYRGKFSLKDAEDILLTTNAELDSYYAKYPAARRVSVTSNPDTAMLDAQGREARTAIYKTLDNPAQGAAAREVQRRYGTLMNLEQELYRRRNVAMRQAPDSLSEQVGKWSAVGDIVGGVLTGRPLSGIATGLAKAKAASWLKEQQTTDALIASAFKNFKGMPAPIVMPAQPEIRGLLGPATPAIGPPMGASVESTGLPPAWQRNVWEGRGAPKLLPPSTLPFSASGVAVPDMAGQIRQGVNREMAGPKLLNKGTAPFTQGISVPEILGRPSRTTGYMLEPPREPGPGGATILPMPGDVLPLDVGTMGYARGSTPMPYPPGKIGAGAPPQEIPPPVDWRNAERLPLGKSPTPPAPGATADGLMPPSPAEGAPAMPISRKPGPPPLAEVPPVDAATAIEKHVAGRESGPFAKAVAEHGQAEQRFVELLNAEKPDKAALKVAAAEVDRLAEPLKGQIGWLSTTAEEIAADAGKTITGKPLDLRVPPPVQ